MAIRLKLHWPTRNCNADGTNEWGPGTENTGSIKQKNIKFPEKLKLVAENEMIHFQLANVQLKQILIKRYSSITLGKRKIIIGE